MHGSIGTSAAIAQLGDDGVMTIHTHSQSVFDTGDAIAQLLGIDKTKVHCIHVPGSGCYGHNMADDVAADAALLAAAVPGKPVKLQYTRAQEHQWEPKGAAQLMQVRGGLDAAGRAAVYDFESSYPSNGAPTLALLLTRTIEPLAQAYAGHQFGGFSPQLGDGRAVLLGEVLDRQGQRRDIAFKGSGRTPFSRGGDGKAAVGPMLREVLIGEAMHALGIPTTRALDAASIPSTDLARSSGR